MIIRIVHVSVCFSLERDVVICLFSVSILNKPYSPLYYICDIKKDDKQFLHLLCMYFFVILLCIGQYSVFFACNNQAEQVNGTEALWRKVFVVYYFHSLNMKQKYFCTSMFTSFFRQILLMAVF